MSHYDKFNTAIGKDDFVRVNNGNELGQKIAYMEEHPGEKKRILSWQDDMIDREAVFMKTENVTLLKNLIFGEAC